MIRNGGRTGIAFTAGFRWALGNDKDKTVETKPKHISLRGVEQNPNNAALLTNDKTAGLLRAQGSLLPRNDMKKTVIKTQKTSQKSRNLARYQALIGE